MGKVKNLKNTADKKCKCSGTEGKWIEHWRLEKGNRTKICRNDDCNNEATLGAHVKKVGVDDHRHFIVPLCGECNGLNEDFSIAYRHLVPAYCI
jgi:hypothetical protein